MSEQRDGQRVEFEDFKLPCDVRLGDHMRIGRGCKMSTLLLALQRRASKDPSSLPSFGLLATLRPEDLEAALAYDGPENFGPPDTEYLLARPAVQPEERGKGS